MNPPLDLHVRCDEDLLACVPLLLGFSPERSVVMLGISDPCAPTARVDLCPDDELDDLCAALVGPAKAHGVLRVALVVYTALSRAEVVTDALHHAFTAAGIEVAGLLAYDGTAWTPMMPGERDCYARTFDVLAHPFVAEAVLNGKVVLGSREELARSVQPVAARVAQTVEALTHAEPASATWVRSTVKCLVETEQSPSAEQVARLAQEVCRGVARDAAWAWVTRPQARRHVDLWLAVVRATPPSRVAAAAAVLAVLAWRAGDGALAWCAVDASRASGESCSLTELVAELLERAVSPDQWPATPSAVDGETDAAQHPGERC